MNRLLIGHCSPRTSSDDGWNGRWIKASIVLTGSVLLALLSACSTLSGKQKPLDINERMPDVSLVVAAVQEAIDNTADNPGWKDSSDYIRAQDLCKSEIAVNQKKYVDACNPAYAEAREKCKKEAGANASVLCADYLREAADTCGLKPDPPDICAVAKQLKPPHIKLARLDFVAGYKTSLGGGISLKLISAKAAAAHGLQGTYSIELVPAPPVESFAKVRSGEQAVVVTSVVRNLSAALTVALNAAVDSKCGVSKPEAELDCAKPDNRQLTLKSASYKFAIDYTTSNGVDFGWSISSLKLVDGTFSAGSDRTTGNVLTVEIER